MCIEAFWQMAFSKILKNNIMIDEEIILDPDPSRVMEGLRDTGYDFNTAIADLIDNSIAANATVVKVHVDVNPSQEFEVYIADNGCGMNYEGLKNAMRYGSAQRSNAASLGKFGLGLKTASTSFCRCLSVISRDKDSEQFLKVRWDLDEICRINKWKLLTPQITPDEYDILEDVTGDSSGTLVVWEKIDRLLANYTTETWRNKALKKTIAELEFHIGMVFQRFLDSNFSDVPNVQIFLNEKLVEPWDPFCKNEPETKSLSEIEQPVDFGNNTHVPFKLNAWLLPREEDFSSEASKKEARVNNEMQGFYIYRENRLIHYGTWLGTYRNEPHYSSLRIEFSFDHRLDEAFQVDIKKSRILLDDAIFEFLKDSFLPAPRREANNTYRNTQNKRLQAQTGKAHDASNTNIETKANSVQQSKVTVTNPSTGEVTVENTNGTTVAKIRVIPIAANGQYRVVPTDTLDNGVLWEPTIVEQKHAVSINKGHEFYRKVYGPNIGNSKLVQGMDALLWALAEAEMATYNDETKEQYEDMRIRVSSIIKKLVKDFPDPVLDENAEE